ncbi:sugar ABC transporter permease [Actinomadura madurae]|uniref:sugar ABC transporter permease n=1 Tax=Actinomadura madurae TaxID=1993 RepID=UPI0020D22EF1|nr:sugar ABC transporter permease [Actinomadura madurae]MCP9948027.1 sugar ABC transporter permease [Actinomadura madurae]MCP9964796.1 sugar ABC transporter permease [Actinomadura madurae]MCP9977280.1 sugar ABC transporter permease [Actinomadura madurae]MCQ0011211.1 sugar ABC transporter permease [Actinomadura madurae]MCQ0013468.1 sugar ABC transporter permease [Actinomadura madurae]
MSDLLARPEMKSGPPDASGDRGVRGALAAMADRVRGGDLGVAPVVAGLVVIWTVMQILNPVFLSSANLVNLALECVPVGVIALGVVFMLLVGQIDLSVGSISGLSAAVVAVLFVDHGWPSWLAVLAAVALAVALGWFYAQVFNRLGVPSFVITLAGLLGWLGLQLWILGPKGSINLPFDSRMVTFAQLDFLPPWLAYTLVVVAAAALYLTGHNRAAQRRGAGLPATSERTLILRAAVLLAGLGVAVWYLNRDRGVGWMFVLFLALVLVTHYALSRTKYGKSMYAVGGNVEAARRAGINVKTIYTSAFVMCTALAAIGGILAAARLAAANQSSGGGDVNLNAIAAAVIGGTSLFGGRGNAFAALLGILVIQSISSGLTLLNLDSSYRFMVTGAVLLLAVALDSVARRSRATHGRA